MATTFTQVRGWLRRAVPHMHTCPGCTADYSHKWETLEHEHDCPLVAFLLEGPLHPRGDHLPDDFEVN